MTMSLRKVFCLWLLLGTLLPAWVIAQEPSTALNVTVPDVQHPYYQARDRYFHELLKLALEHSGEPFAITLLPLPEYKETRSEFFLRSGEYDVHWLNATPRREKHLRSVKFPLFRGMIGWRLFFIHPQSREKFAAVDSVDDLARLTAVQGYDWADTPLLRQNDFDVQTSSSWPGMFQMVRLGRADYFPRSVIEIFAESQHSAAEGLVIEESLVLQYPAAYFFYVHPDRERLASALLRGLVRAQETGAFDELFQRYFGEQIERANLSERQILEIPNPVAADLLPLDQPGLWFTPQK